ncbi:MAG: NapC/NirT family cytochrome c [Sulfuriflexus sp.]|nr:NapC/NirT family cytochrome c [Sulfuriflexus sp.]
MFVMFALGIIFWGGFNTGMEATNNEEFCISCHEMRNNVYQEYKQTVHYTNRTGVRATCPDCHVPREWEYMVVRKVKATNELLHKIIGSIDTPEKFEAKRLQLAEHVWDSMKETDSRECKNCHANEFMKLNSQSKLSQRKHARGIKDGLTCIECHRGIAHQLPKDFDADGKLHASFKKTKRPCGDCHKHLAQSDEAITW